MRSFLTIVGLVVFRLRTGKPTTYLYHTVAKVTVLSS